MGRFCLHVVAATLCTLALASHAAIGGLPTNTGDRDTSDEWQKIKTVYFENKSIHEFAGTIEIDIPRRAAFGATVPTVIRATQPQSAERWVRKIYLVVDKNPSPIAAIYTLTPDMGKVELETRIRVDEYSHVRAIAEMNDGQLYSDARYVKVSGGCTAKPNRDQAKHMAELGTIKFRLPDKFVANQPNTVHVHVSHPNNTGFELDHITVMFIPPHYVRKTEVTFAGKPVLVADTDFSISEDPYLKFNFVPKSDGELKCAVEDSKDMKWEKAVPVKVQ